MPSEFNPSWASTERRQRAKQRMRERPSDGAVGMTEAETKRLIQKLQIHQIEMEMQQEELQFARSELEKGLAKYSDLYDFAPIGYLTLNREGTIQEINLTMATLLAVPRSALVNQPMDSFVAAADRQEFLAFLEAMFANGLRQERDLKVCPKGKVPVDVRLNAVASESGQECRLVVTVITEHKRMEDELKASLREVGDLKAALDVHAIVAITDPQGKITYVNDKFCAISKYTRDELLGQDHRIINSGHHSKEFFRDLWNTIARGRVWQGEIKNQAKDGSFYWVDATIVPMLDDHGKPRQYVAIRADITARKQAEDDRLILNKLESTGILAGGMAHDFNNLLTTILLNLALLQESSPPAATSTKLLDEARKAVLMARGLTQQLIALAQGGAPLRKPTCVAGLIEEAVRASLSGSRVGRDLHLADDLWWAEVDEGQVAQVIRNIVLNAREAMPEGGSISVLAENAVLVTHPSLPPGDYIRVTIADHGPGIPVDVLPKIFDPYFSTKRRGSQKGMGLGLTICHVIVQKHGGAIDVESKIGCGTTFHIHVPACRAQPGPEAASDKVLRPRAGRILLMDDEEGVREIVGALLQHMGHEVELVADGDKAVDAYVNARQQQHPFDAVIFDLTVRGGVGGQEALRILLERDPGVKAIVMSGYAEDPAVLEPERYGFKGVLPKPFDMDDLRDVLARVMGAG
jgi:PAS domain S-box-containing protein